MTQGLTLVMVVSLYFLGGEIIHDFALALLVGFVVGTYSSIYVASPIVLTWEEHAKKK
jgi:preprotein translocase subunit SecF